MIDAEEQAKQGTSEETPDKAAGWMQSTAGVDKELDSQGGKHTGETNATSSTNSREARIKKETTSG